MHLNSCQRKLKFDLTQVIGFLFLVFFPFFSAYSQIVQIDCISPPYLSEGDEVSIVGYSNYITYKEQILDVDTVGDSSKFHLEVNCKKASLVSIRFRGEDNRGEDNMIFIEPGAHYKLNIGKEWVVPLLYIEEEINGNLNARIDSFKIELARLVIPLSSFILRGGIPPKLDSSLAALEKCHLQEGRPYLNNYIKYRIALVQQMTFRKKRTQFNEKYIIGQPVLEDHDVYVEFIDQYFSNYLIGLNVGADADLVMKCINESSNLEILFSVMEKDQRLANDTLREFVLIKGLFEAYNHPDYEKEKVLVLLRKIASNTKYEKHKELVSDVVFSLTYLKPGYHAPDFELYTIKGKLIRLSDFEGKLIYLNFWSSGSMTCVKENQLIPKLAETFSEDVVFINISLDKDYKKMKQHVKTIKDGTPKPNQYFLHFGNQKSITQTYQIKTLPSYFFVGRDGKFVQSPAEPPSGNIKKTFETLFHGDNKEPSINDPGE